MKIGFTDLGQCAAYLKSAYELADPAQARGQAEPASPLLREPHVQEVLGDEGRGVA